MNRRELLKLLAGAPLLPAVKDVSVLRAAPDDLIVLTCDQKLSHDQLERLRQTWRKIMPDHQRVVVFDQGLDIAVLRKDRS